MRGLLIGRFQPFHKGHLSIIKKILKEADELFIVIGSSQYKNTKENPLSANEREEMIKRVLDSGGIKNYKIFKVPDINDDDLYPSHAMKIVPSFDVVYSGNDLVQRLFTAAEKKVKKIKHIRRTAYSGTEIRKRIIEGGDWEQLVPSAVVEYLTEIEWVERVKKLSSL
ncbi:MAG: nicotinamide-nucleotide adenylyltransferase [Candidatus Hydrothermarchaeales archaeon]